MDAALVGTTSAVMITMAALHHFFKVPESDGRADTVLQWSVCVLGLGTLVFLVWQASWLLIGVQVLVWFGASVPYLEPDERSWAAKATAIITACAAAVWAVFNIDMSRVTPEAWATAKVAITIAACSIPMGGLLTEWIRGRAPEDGLRDRAFGLAQTVVTPATIAFLLWRQRFDLLLIILIANWAGVLPYVKKGERQYWTGTCAVIAVLGWIVKLLWIGD